jgi:hypothetical protein
MEKANIHKDLEENKKQLQQINCFEVLCILENLKEMGW